MQQHPLLQQQQQCPGSPSSSSRSVQLPLFGKNGKALSYEERCEIARKRGVCKSCGVQTHKITLGAIRTSLNNTEVYQGICVRCNRELVPPKVYSEWKLKHSSSSLGRTTPDGKQHQRSRSGGGGTSGADASSDTGPPSGRAHRRSRSAGGHSYDSLSLVSMHKRTSSNSNFEGLSSILMEEEISLLPIADDSTSSLPRIATPPSRQQKRNSSSYGASNSNNLGVDPSFGFMAKHRRSSSGSCNSENRTPKKEIREGDERSGSMMKIRSSPVLTVFEAAPLVYEDEESGQTELLPALDLDTESSVLKEALKDTRIRLDFQTATTNNLGAWLSRGQHELLHLSCHGHKNYIFIENEHGGAQMLLVNEHLKPWIRTAGSSSKLKFVFVSACQSRSAGEAFIEAGVQHVVCCEQDIQNHAAIIFTRDIYRSLAYGKTLQQAFDMAVHAVILSPELKRTGFDPEKESQKFTLLPKGGDHRIVLFPSAGESSADGQKQEHPLLAALSSQQLILPRKSSQSTANANLVPLPPASFMGRELDMYQVLRALFIRKCRLVRVSGAPSKGIGKAALAMAVGHYIAKRKMWGDTVVWLPSKRKLGVPDASSSVVKKMLQYFEALQKQDEEAINTIKEYVVDELYETKAVIIVHAKEMPKSSMPELSSFLDDVFERTKHVKVILVNSKEASQGIQSRHVSGFSCPEAEICLKPLDFRTTAMVFGKICQHSSPSTWSKEVLRQKESSEAFQVMGNGVPERIRLIAKQLSPEEYDKLVQPGQAIICTDFERSLSHLRSILNSDDDGDEEVAKLQREDSAVSLRSQDEDCARFRPLLKSEGKIYRKKVSSFIRRAKKGENVVTTLDDVEETAMTVKNDNCSVVCGRAAGEQYVISDQEFRENYDEGSAKPIEPDCSFPNATQLRQEGFLEYRSRRRVWARQIDEEDMKFFRRRSKDVDKQTSTTPTRFIAPWGEPMRVELGDYLAMTYPESTQVEVYRIEAKAFGLTYACCEEERNQSHASGSVYIAGAAGAVLAVSTTVMLMTRKK